MSIKDALHKIFIAEGHEEQVGRIDRMNGVGVEDFAAESRAEVSKPKGSKR